ncbi:Gfo/Idh/MocA family oxidoreductase [Mycobacterium sp. AT1]|uniref:Gfo/Idh/MocA family oxidoreductase n=1 Tax=Mycobacterium sp. AT1 TaxID=1961706 RepID=UPI001150260D|nr:Gfo/Idh/MocA family oxidoreductase [Mycobacterium sp. AT1]
MHPALSTIDDVQICSPNHMYHEEALATLRAGKHAVCEKPLAMTSAQAMEFRDVAEASAVVHAVCEEAYRTDEVTALSANAVVRSTCR